MKTDNYHVVAGNKAEKHKTAIKINVVHDLEILPRLGGEKKERWQPQISTHLSRHFPPLHPGYYDGLCRLCDVEVLHQAPWLNRLELNNGAAQELRERERERESVGFWFHISTMPPSLLCAAQSYVWVLDDAADIVSIEEPPRMLTHESGAVQHIADSCWLVCNEDKTI